VELGGWVVRVLELSQLIQRDKSWVRSLYGFHKIASLQNSHLVTCLEGKPRKHDWLGFLLRPHLWILVEKWLECWTQVNFNRARGRGFNSWSDLSKLPGLKTVTWSRVQRVNRVKTIDQTFFSELICRARWGVVRVLNISKLYRSEKSWVQSLDGPFRIAKPQNSHVVKRSAGWLEKHDWQSLLLRAHPSSSVAEWIEC